jgi:gliding motility-associated-like protein
MAKNLRIKLFLLFFLFGIGKVEAQGSKKWFENNPFKNHYFVENKGQWDSTFPGVKFLMNSGENKIQLFSNGYAWRLTEILKPTKPLPGKTKIGKKDRIILHETIRQTFLNANSNPQIFTQNKSNHYNTFGPKKWNSYGYTDILIKDIYPHIDLQFISNENLPNQFKYNLILHQGAKLEDIKIQFSGDSNINITNYKDSISISGKLFKLIENQLNCFDENHKKINIHYTFENNILGFKSTQKTKFKTLFIDPYVNNIRFFKGVSLFPARLANLMQMIDFDYQNNLYAMSFVPEYPEVAKYDSTGKLLWIFSGQLPSINWYSAQSNLVPGAISVYKYNQSFYMGPGYQPLTKGNEIVRINEAGNWDSFQSLGTWKAPELWDLTFHCPTKTIFGSGGGPARPINLFTVDPTKTKSQAIERNITGDSTGLGQDIIISKVDKKNSFYSLLNKIVGVKRPYLIDSVAVRIFIILSNKDLNSFDLQKRISEFKFDFWEYNNNIYQQYANNRFNGMTFSDSFIFVYDGKVYGAYAKDSLKELTIDSITSHKPRYNKRNMGQSGIATDNCGHVFFGSDSGRIKAYFFDGSKFTFLKNIQVFPAPTKRKIVDIQYNEMNQTLFVAGDSFVASLPNPYSCPYKSDFKTTTSDFGVCHGPFWAKVSNPDTSIQYTFLWVDSNTNTTVRNVTLSHKFSDTLSQIIPNHTYILTVAKNYFCNGQFLKHRFLKFPTQDSTLFDTLCQGQSFVLRKRSFLSDTTFTDTLVNLYGCDSIMTYKLHFLKKSFYSQKIVICKGDTLRVGPKSYVSSGSFIDTLVNAVGCDSVVSTALTVSYDSISQNVHVCNTYFYKVGNQSYYKPGIYVAKFKNRFGCDSIIRTVLTMASDTIIRRKKTLCSGDLYTVGTHTYTKTGIYNDTFKRFNGCDSFVKSTLKFISDTTISQSISICQGDSLKVGKNVYKASDNYTDSLKKFLGCDSVIHTKLSVYPKYAQNKLIRLCPKESIVINGVNYNKSQNFKYRYTSVNGCDSVVEFNIIKSDLESIFDIDSTKTPAITFNNTSKKDVKFYWKFDQSTVDSINRKVTKNYPNDSNRTFEICLIVKDSFGCIDTICQQLKMSKLMYYLFNTFTPNNDGYNDVYNIKTVGGSLQYSLEVYSRWGVKVFEVRDANSSDQSKLWNGKVMNNGADCPSGSYFALFRLYLNGSSKDPEIVNGVIMLIRE